MLDLTTCLTTSLTSLRRTAAPALALALGAGLLVGCSRDAQDPAPDAPGDTPASTSSTPTTEGSGGNASTDSDSSGDGDTAPDLTPEEVTEVEQGTEDFYDDSSVALGKPKKTPKPADYPHVTGDALEGLFNEVAEFQDNGWKMVGEPQVVQQSVVRRTTDPDSVVVRACVDNSAVRVQDRFGDEVPNSRPTAPRTLNVLTLVRKGGAWVVTDQRLAAKPDC